MENRMGAPWGNPGLSSGKESGGKESSGKENSEVALGLRPHNQLGFPGCAQLCPGALLGFCFLQGAPALARQGMPMGRKHLFPSAGWPRPVRGPMAKPHLKHILRHGAWSRQTGTAPKSRSQLMR